MLDSWLEEEIEPSVYASPERSSRLVPAALIANLGFTEELGGSKPWGDAERDRLCDGVAERVDVRRGALVFAEDLRAKGPPPRTEAMWKQDVDCHLKDVPSRLRFNATPSPSHGLLELRVDLAWTDADDGNVRGHHRFLFQLEDWQRLEYGMRLEWLTDEAREFLDRSARRSGAHRSEVVTRVVPEEMDAADVARFPRKMSLRSLVQNVFWQIDMAQSQLGFCGR